MREALSVDMIPNVMTSFSSAACFYALSFPGGFLFCIFPGVAGYDLCFFSLIAFVVRAIKADQDIAFSIH